MGKLKLGVLGVSGHLQTRMLLPMTQSEDVKVVALASRQLEKAKRVAEQWGIKKAYGSYEELLEDPDIEAVYIPLPNHMHVEWIKKSIEAGKHVLCEKPLTMTADETKDLMKYMKGSKLKLMEAFMYRFHPKWKMVKELMKVNGIGEIQSIQTVFTYSNNDMSNIRNIKEYGGGALMDIGCYAISSARYILGKEPNRVMSLVHYSEATNTDVLSSGILDFGKARALFTVGTSMYPAQEVRVYGTGGTLEVIIPFNDLYDVKGKVKVTTGLGERVVDFKPINQYGCLLSAFAEAIREDKEVPVSLPDSYMNMKIIDQLFKSGESGQWEDVK